MIENPNTNWDGVKTTDTDAKPCGWQDFANKPLVHIKHGSIRKATFENQWFLLVEHGERFQNYDDKLKIIVQCLWKGRKPPDSWMHITVKEGEFEVFENHSQTAVVVNIG